MAVTKNDVVEYLKGMTLLEASELVKELEEVFGVSAAAAAAPGEDRRTALSWVRDEDGFQDQVQPPGPYRDRFPDSALHRFPIANTRRRRSGPCGAGPPGECRKARFARSGERGDRRPKTRATRDLREWRARTRAGCALGRDLRCAATRVRHAAARTPTLEER